MEDFCSAFAMAFAGAFACLLLAAPDLLLLTSNLFIISMFARSLLYPSSAR